MTVSDDSITHRLLADDFSENMCCLRILRSGMFTRKLKCARKSAAIIGMSMLPITDANLKAFRSSRLISNGFSSYVMISVWLASITLSFPGTSYICEELRRWLSRNQKTEVVLLVFFLKFLFVQFDTGNDASVLFRRSCDDSSTVPSYHCGWENDVMKL